MTTYQGQDTCINSKHFEELFSQQQKNLSQLLCYSKFKSQLSFLICCTNSNTERNILSSVKPSHSRGIFLWSNFSRGPILKHNHHMFPKWVILPRISYGDKLFSLKQEWRTKLVFLERKYTYRVANISLCAILKYFLS